MSTVSFFIYVGLGFFILTGLAIVDVAYRDFGSLRAKAVWWLVAMIPFLGFIIYFLFGARRGKRQSFFYNPPPESDNKPDNV